MTTGGLVFGAVLGLILFVIIVTPFLRRNSDPKRVNMEQWEMYQLQYERALTNIRDLDEDFALGKIQPDFHQSERQKLMEQGVNLLKSMESLQPDMSVSEIDAVSDDAVFDDAIEQAIASKRKQKTT